MPPKPYEPGYLDWSAQEFLRLAELGRQLAQTVRDGTQCQAHACCMPRNTNGYCADHAYLAEHVPLDHAHDDTGKSLALSLRADLGQPSLLADLHDHEPPPENDDTPVIGVEAIQIKNEDAPDQD